MSKIIRPIAYETLLDMRQTEQGIKMIKEFFQDGGCLADFGMNECPDVESTHVP